MKKLSELKDDDILLMGETVITKVDILDDLEFIKNHSKNKDNLYTTTKYYANIDAKDMLDSALENEYQNMYEDWYEDAWDDVTDEDIKDIQAILDRILARNKSKNTCYIPYEKVEFDL